MSPVLPLFKVATLLFRTVAKPIANTVKNQARRNETFRKGCISLAQKVNYAETRLKRFSRDDKAKEVRRLDDERAIALGANFISEAILFSAACVVIVWEQTRSRKSSQNYKNDVDDSIEELKRRVKEMEARLGIAPPPAPEKTAAPDGIVQSLRDLVKSMIPS